MNCQVMAMKALRLFAMPFFIPETCTKGKEREELLMKEKKKMSLAMQIFIALVLAIIAGLLMQSFHHVRYHFHE